MCLQLRRPGFNPCVGKIPWRRKWWLTPVSLPGKSHGQRSLVGCSPWGLKELDPTERLTLTSVQFSHSVVSDSLRLYKRQHARPPCPSPTPRVHPKPCPLSWCCHPTISFVVPFSSCHQSFPASGSFPMSQLFASDGQSIFSFKVFQSFSFNICPSNERPGLISFRMDWLDLLAVQGTLKSFLQHHSSKASILRCSAFFIVHSHIHTWPLEKP